MTKNLVLAALATVAIVAGTLTAPAAFAQSGQKATGEAHMVKVAHHKHHKKH